MPLVMARVNAVKAMRLASKKAATRGWANQPAVFTEDRQPKDNYLLIPRVSSERRLFIPIGFLSRGVIASDATMVVPNATLIQLGILASTMHNAWLRSVCGRLKSDFRYSAGIVYNNFPWPVIVSDTVARQSIVGTTGLPRHDVPRNDKQIAAIESAAQAVLDARAAHPQASLADLYDPLTMPTNLLKAHQVLDKAVDAAYGYKGVNTDAARVAFLFGRYQAITSLLPAVGKARKTRKQ
jgi:hypothetical protein